MVTETIATIIKESWPMISIFCIIVISVRLMYLRVNHKHIVLYKELFGLVFLVYILMLFELVSNTDISQAGINVTPFKEITRYEFGSNLFIYNIIGNIILFLPFGFFISSYINLKKITQIIFLVIIISTSIELVQYEIGRSFDIDDIILNVIGAAFGFLLYISLNAISRHLPSIFSSELFYNIIAILLIIIASLIVLNQFGIGWL